MPDKALSYTYAYPRESAIVSNASERRLRLVTDSTMAAASAPPTFFRGLLVAPKRTADLLVSLSDVVGSRFHTPSAMLQKILLLADPVITCTGERLRFEGFSSCCGAYARLDVLAPALDGEFLGVGTANVDFNAPMRAALSQVSDRESLAFELGSDRFEVRRDSVGVVERTVDLPMRWVRGFSEVQAYQARMRPVLEIGGAELRRFLRELPAQWKGDAFVAEAAGGLRLSARSGDVRVGGVTRLRALRLPAEHAVSARVYADDSGASAWVIATHDSRFVLVLSPDVWRGFSGEGQTLDALARPSKRDALAATRGALRWQNAIDAAEIAVSNGIAVDDVRTALADLAVSGIVGYDLAEGAYFQRELPFYMEASRERQPRLRAAEKLFAEDRVEIEREGDAMRAWVSSGAVTYRVSFAADGEGTRCTCPWYAKHRDARGPCKHVLAARLFLERARA